MKKLVFPVIGSLLVVGFIACKKDSAASHPSQTSLDASKQTSIAKGEPVQFSLSQAPSTAAVAWTVSPSANTQVNANGNKATILFGASGTYTINAVSPGLSASSSVTVTDSVYNPGGAGTNPTTLNLQANEVIHINLARNDSGLVSGLIFSAQTSNTYACNNNSLISEQSQNSTGFLINYTGVSVPANCSTGTSKAGAFNGFYPIPTGNSQLSITVNGKTYTGTINHTGNGFTINWPNTTAVTVSPTSL